MPAAKQSATKQPVQKQPPTTQAVWERLLNDMERVRGAIKHAQTALSNEAPAVSATTRRRATARAAGELHKAALCVEGALNDLQRLQRVAATHSGRVANLSGRLHQVESVLSDKTQQLQHLQRQVSTGLLLPAPSCTAVDDDHHLSMEEMQRHLNQVQAKCDAVTNQMQELVCKHSSEVDGLEKKLQHAQEALHHAEQELAQHVAAQKHHHTVTERQQRVVAAVTADNVMHMVKLRAAHDEAATLRSQVDTLRTQLESQQGPWFEQVRSGVQHHVHTALTRMQDAESALEQATAKYEAEQAVLKQHMADAQARAHHAEARASELEAKWETHVASCEKSKACAAEAAQHAQRAADMHAAQVEVLQQTVHDLQQALHETQAQLATRTTAHDDTLEQLAAATNTLEQRDTHIATLHAQLEQQQDINNRLMARKQDVEWQLLQALANTKGS